MHQLQAIIAQGYTRSVRAVKESCLGVEMFCHLIEVMDYKMPLKYNDFLLFGRLLPLHEDLLSLFSAAAL